MSVAARLTSAAAHPSSACTIVKSIGADVRTGAGCLEYLPSRVDETTTWDVPGRVNRTASFKDTRMTRGVLSSACATQNRNWPRNRRT